MATGIEGSFSNRIIMAPKKEQGSEAPIPEACPHCGAKLSPWQQVLLGVDRALMCVHCWYRILLDARGPEKPGKNPPDSGE